MRNDPIQVAWQVEASRDEEAGALKTLLAEQIDLGRMVTDEAITFPDHQALTVTRDYRLGDFFDLISVEPGPRDGVVTLSFHRRPNETGLWKDLMMAIVRSLQATDAKVTLRRDLLSRPIAYESEAG